MDLLDSDDELFDQRIVDMSEDVLIDLGCLGEKANPHVRAAVETIRSDRELFGFFRLRTARSVLEQHTSAAQPSPPIPEHVQAYTTTINNPEARTVVPPHLISEFERRYYYNGICSSGHPELVYRSDLETNPFPIPAPGSSYSDLPTKVPRGISGTPLNKVWDAKVSPAIRQLMRDSGIKWSSLSTARFITFDQEKKILGPVVIWIGVHPGTTTAETLRDFTPNILRILSDLEIDDVVVEWYEGVTERL